MKVQENIDKISWTGLDKAVFVLYGIVTIFQINSLDPIDFGLYLLLINLNTYIFMVSDALSLQGLIQFGMDRNTRGKVNLITLISHITIVLGASLIIYLAKENIADIFDETRLIGVGGLLPLLVILTIPRTYSIKMMYRDHELNKVFFSDLLHFGIMTVMTFYYIYYSGSLNYDKMVFLYFSGTLISSLFSVLLIFRKLKFSFIGDLTLRKYFSFGIPLMLQAGFHSLPKLLDIWIVQYFFSAGSVGIYGLAKNLYRIFDEAGNAAYGLIYPVAVRQIQKNNLDELKSLLTKSLSFMLLFMLVPVLLLELGFADLIIDTFLPGKYFEAIGQFKLLLIAAIGIPFVLMSLVITAFGKPQVVMLYSFVSVIVSLFFFILTGIWGRSDLIPLGIISYNIIFGALCWYYLKSKLNIPWRMVFRVIFDTWYFIKSKFNK